jgi:hypothetical protein
MLRGYFYNLLPRIRSDHDGHGVKCARGLQHELEPLGGWSFGRGLDAQLSSAGLTPPLR